MRPPIETTLFTRRYTEIMRVALLVVGVAFLSSHAVRASTVHVFGIENIPSLMASSDVVCKGEVVEAQEVTFSTTPALPELPRRTATAIVRADRSFKGNPPSNQPLPVLFDQVLPGGATTGGRIYVVLVFSQQSDPLQMLEIYLKAGLRGSDHDRVLDSIRMLGNMQHLQSEAELTGSRHCIDTKNPFCQSPERCRRIRLCWARHREPKGFCR